ncbi:MAG TPA: hypothetical protein DCO86_03875 [Spirochaetaceae bacterium]|nr:hypothetical protein [Spirochaetaceae bacterium]
MEVKDNGLVEDKDAVRKAKKLKFVELHEDVVLNGICIPAYTRLPIMTDSEMVKGSMEIDKNAIILGLAEAVRTNVENEDIAFFKRILLNDRTLVERLMKQVSSIGKDSSIDDIKRNYHAIQLLRCLQETELSFVNQALALINMIHDEIDDEAALEDMEDELFELLKAGLELYPKSYSLLFHMADYHKNMGNFELAEKYADKLNENGYDDDEVAKLKEDIRYYSEKNERILYIYDLVNLNRIDDAIRSTNEFLSTEKDDWHANFLLGWAYRLKEDYENAEKCLLQSVAKGGGDFAENFNELSLAAWNLGKKELAIKYSEMAADLDEKSVAYACNTAMMCLETKDYENAYRYLCDTWKLDSNDEVLKELIGRYEKETGSDFAYPKPLKEIERQGENCCHHEKRHD